MSKTGLFEVTFSGILEDGHRLWQEWAAATDSAVWYREALRQDDGRYLGYVGLVSRRISGPELARHAWPSTLMVWPGEYVPHPLLRDDLREPAGRTSLWRRLRRR